MVKQVLNYHDVHLYDSDVALFGTFQWLNDNAINFYFQYVYHTVCLSSSAASDVLLVDPAVVSCMMLQCDDDDEYVDLGRGLCVQEKALCLLPVNDNQSFDSESSHWSLLVYENQRFVHYDSSAGHNTTAAKKIARTFLQLLGASGVDNVPTWSSGLFVNDRDAPQQQNGYDCGMYVLVVAEFLCRQRCRREEEGATAISLRDYATADRVTALRLEIPCIVQRLQEDEASALTLTATSGPTLKHRWELELLSTAAKLMMIQVKPEGAVSADVAGATKRRAGLLDTRSYQELEPLQLPSKLRDRINKAQRRAAAEKDGISIFASNVSASLPADDQVGSSGSRTKDDSVGGSGRAEAPRRRASQVVPVGSDATPSSGTCKEKLHLPDVIIGHKMREFEAKINVNALFVDPLETNLHHLSIDDKEKVMLRMQEKIQGLTAQIDTHFVQIKRELDTHGIFDAAANTQRAQALCLVELQKRCKLERLRDEAMREVLDENGGASHAALSEMEGKLNDLLTHNTRAASDQTDTSAQLAFSHLQKSTKSFALKRRPAVAKRTLSPVKRKPPLVTPSNQLSHEIKTSTATDAAHADPTPDTTVVTSIPPAEDWTSRHPHIVHALQHLSANGGVPALLTVADTLDSFSSRLDLGSSDSSPMSLAEEWFERSSSYQIIACRALEELQQRWARWRWDSTKHFHPLGNNPLSSAEIVLPDALQRRLERQRETASARLREEDARQRLAASDETTARKRERAEAEYHQLQDGIQARRQEREKRSLCASKRASTGIPRARWSSASVPEKAGDAKRAVTADGGNLDANRSKRSVHDPDDSSARHTEKPHDGSIGSSNDTGQTQGTLVMSASAPLLGRRDAGTVPEGARSRVDSRMPRDPKLPKLPHQRTRRARVRADTLVGGRSFLDVTTLGHFSSSRSQERRDSAQTWAWYAPHTRARLGGGTHLTTYDERSDGEEDDDEQTSDAGVGGVTSGDEDANDGDDVYCNSDRESDDDGTQSGEDAKSVMSSSASSRYLMDSARTSFSVMSKKATYATQLGNDGEGMRRRMKGASSKASKRRGSRGRHDSSPLKRAGATVRGPHGSRLTSRTSNSSNVSGSSGGMFAGIHFTATANAQVLQHRLEELWSALDFPFSSKLIMLEKYANLEDPDALSRALTHWEAAVEMVSLREKLIHILAEFEELKDLKASSRLTPAEWSCLLIQQIDIPPNAINLSSKDLVEWTQSHMDTLTYRCEKLAQQVKVNTGDELIFQGHRYPPRV